MSLRSLLIVTHHFPPSAASGAFRALGFVNHLPKFGWQTAVVASDAMPLEPVDPSLRQRIRRGASVAYVEYPTGWRSRWARAALSRARMVDPHCVWLPGAWRACVEQFRHSPYQAVLTSGPPHSAHLVGLALKHRFGVSWVADFRDPWVTAGVNSRRSPRRRRTARWLEKTVIEKADLVIANTPGGARAFAAQYPSHQDKIEVITNGYDPELYSQDRAAIGALPSKVVRLVHAGELYWGRDPRPLFEALAALQSNGVSQEDSVRAEFYGRWNDSGIGLLEEVRRHHLEEIIQCHGQIAYDRILKVLAAADILLLLDTPGRRLGIPAKLFEYLGTGRPILALCESDGDVAWALRTSGARYRIASPTSPAAIQAALSNLLVELKKAPEKNHRDQALVFTRENMARSLARALGDRTQARQ